MRKIAIVNNKLVVLTGEIGGCAKWEYDIQCFRNPPNRCQPDCSAFEIRNIVPDKLGVYCNATFTHNPIGELVELKPGKQS